MNLTHRIVLILALFLALYIPITQGDCKNKDNHHTDENVIRCTYTQQDIDRACKRIPSRYSQDKCFFCGCSKDQHSTE